MKILMMSSYFPQLGGIESYVKTLSEWLAERGCKVIICTLGREDTTYSGTSKNIIIFNIK